MVGLEGGGLGAVSPPPSRVLCLPPPQCVAYFLRRRLRQGRHPGCWLLFLSMAGYLREADFVMVEEGFSTHDLLEELTLGASQATAVRAPHAPEPGHFWGFVFLYNPIAVP